MSTIVIATRSAGQVILDSFFNDLKSAFGGDFVGRDSSGNPALGQNLGTQTYPWGTLYTNNIVLGGTAFNKQQLEAPAYQIVSGKTRSGSNQPAFIQAAGSSPTFSVLATSTNLVLSIAGVTATWTADKSSIGITPAFSTGNTATVSDTSASGQAATRTWGEYGSDTLSGTAGGPYYAIGITSVGSHIQSLAGTWQAFKHGSEYFIGYISPGFSTITQCFRGFFFDSSLNPIPRSEITNGDTITLMNLGWVFADQDLTTTDTVFTNQNSSPTFSYSSPTSPSSGDYWFDQVHQVWNRYNGSSWIQVNRTLIGLVVADSTNCVASRSFDFFGLCRKDNTIELCWVSATKMTVVGLNERINVNGKRLDFFTSAPVWNTANNLAASTERYNAAVQASSTEYFYITDQGDTKISDMEPYWRADLLGYYHPFNPWRCVGQVSTDGSANFTSNTVVSYLDSVTYTRPKAKTTSSSSSTFGTSSAGFQDVSGLSVTVTTQGGRFAICMVSDGSGNDSNWGNGSVSSNDSPGADLKLLRGSTELARVSSTQLNNLTAPWSFYVPPPGFLCFDDVGPGTYTYKIQIGGSHLKTVSYCVLQVTEI